MRPVKLTIEGFGSFCQKTVIDFSVFGSQGVYLIAGDTGSGKTTIFDAICFALYDEPSGSYREKRNFRSEYASSGIPTEVELVFEHRGGKYTIRRNTEYERPAQRGSGMTMELPSVSFTMPDGEIFDSGSSGSGGMKEVNLKIKEEIGLDYDQFVQAVMLPQNNFTKLVNAKTDDRLAILKKIYNTEIYASLQEKLKFMVKEEKDELDRINNSIQEIRERLALKTEDEVAELQARHAAMTEERNRLEERRDELEATKKNLEKRIEQEEHRRKLEKETEDSENNILKLKSELETLLGNQELIKEKQPKIDEYKVEAENIKASADDYERLEVLASDLQKAEKEHTEFKEKLEKAEQNLQNEKQRLEDIDKRLENRDEVKDKISQIQLHLVDPEREKEMLEKAGAMLSGIQNKTESLKVLTNKHEEARKQHKKDEQRYIEALDRYEASQSYLLAQTLKEGEPCPVCGSKNHPHPAEETEDTIDKASLESHKQKAEASSKNREDALQALKKEEGSLNEKKKAFFDMEIIADMVADDLDECSLQIKSKKEKAVAKIAGLEDELHSLKQEAEKNKELASEKEVVKESITSLEKEREENREEIATLVNEISSKEGQKDELGKKLKYGTKDEAAEKLAGLQSEIEIFQDEKDENESAMNRVQGELDTEKGRHSTNIENLKKHESIDLEETKKQLSEVNGDRNNIQETISNLAGELLLCEADMASIEKLRKKREKIYDELGPIEGLSKAVGGKVAGEVKMDLEIYIQRMYFEKVVNKANDRLRVLSDERFSLNVREEALDKKGKAGLDLNVFDQYTREERPLSALSGGESFQVALSLALGLSDQVQSSMGGIEMDTLFIDEGFGSLSGDNLRQAMKMLNDLAAGNVLIGIISHVEEVKNSVDQQILVTNVEGEGSSVEIRE